MGCGLVPPVTDDVAKLWSSCDDFVADMSQSRDFDSRLLRTGMRLCMVGLVFIQARQGALSKARMTADLDIPSLPVNAQFSGFSSELWFEKPGEAERLLAVNVGRKSRGGCVCKMSRRNFGGARM